MKIGIAGYGNLGKAVEKALISFTNIKLIAIFTRRNISQVNFDTDNFVYPFEQIIDFKNEIDVIINCMGSDNDAAFSTALIANNFNVIDAFDNNNLLYSHQMLVNSVAKINKITAIVGVGVECYLEANIQAFLQTSAYKSSNYTLAHTGASLTHAHVIRQIAGVIDVKRFIIMPTHKEFGVSSYVKHQLVCYIYTSQDADRANIEKEIKCNNLYFSKFYIKINFVDYETFLSENLDLSGKITLSDDSESSSNFNLSFSYNCQANMTANVLINYAKAIYKMHKNNMFGAFSVLQVRPCDLIDNDNLDF